MPLSGRTTVIVVLVSLVVSAALVPFALHLPLWMEAEAVLVAWWLVLAVTLATLLYRGWRLADDHVHRMPKWWYSSAVPRGSESSSESGETARERMFGFLEGAAIGWPEGCALFVLFSVVFFVFVGLWLFFTMVVVELLLPLLFLLAYRLMLGALARVANDDHECEGKLACSVLWGSVWSTVYLLPLAAAVWLIQAVVVR